MEEYLSLEVLIMMLLMSFIENRSVNKNGSVNKNEKENKNGKENKDEAIGLAVFPNPSSLPHHSL